MYDAEEFDIVPDEYDNYEDSYIDIDESDTYVEPESYDEEEEPKDIEEDTEEELEEETEEDNQQQEEEETTLESEYEKAIIEKEVFAEYVSDVVDDLDEKIDYIAQRLEYQENKIQEYEEILENKEELIAIKKFVEGNPTLYMKLYAPEYLTMQGIDPRLTEQEKVNIVTEELTKRFGKNYYEKFDPDEATTEGTLSHKMYTLQQRILEDLNGPVRLDPERTKEIIRETIIEKYGDTEPVLMSREDYRDYLLSLPERLEEEPLMPEDYYILDNLEKIIGYFIDKSIQIGRNQALNELRSYGSEYREEYKPKETYKDRFDPMNPWGKFKPLPFKK